ncbi:hypothetical protein [Cesiribacter andamanensis]|uniref:Phosphate-selective porin n=1 Tax=Cesiribacter andamanensis AMV16 TaxID=1279009 RepID=M7NU16_9BACT|nr:hypothetical protein [Cesiribacter andamanensis]EMR01984.1 hypothetical protein ADICEAN_02876 [Cesiribacter andamanensis AMV16]
MKPDKRFTGFLCLLLLAVPCLAGAQEADTLGAFPEEKTPLVRLDGYVKELAMLSFTNQLTNVQYDNIIHSRLNSHWTFGPRLTGKADLRVRLFNGSTVRNTPGYGGVLGEDQGVMDLSWVPLDQPQALLHAQIDRLYLDWEEEKWSLRAGRQRVNWGKTYVWNPNDLFNAFAYLDFDYEERPGADAIRFQYYSSFASGYELAYQPHRDWSRSIVGGMYRGNYKGYDYQLLAAHYRQELALGGGWAGNIKTLGFKGEATYFRSEGRFLKEPGYLLASMGLDYAFSNSLYVQAEGLYNGSPLVRQPGVGLFGSSQIAANNLFPSRAALFLNASYPLHPLVAVSLGGIQGFEQDLRIIIPSVTVSIRENLAFLLMAQLLQARELRELRLNQNFLFGRIKWSF